MLKIIFNYFIFNLVILVKFLTLKLNLQVTKARLDKPSLNKNRTFYLDTFNCSYAYKFSKWRLLVGTSEAIRLFSIKANFDKSPYDNEMAFNQWLAGVIDGDGYISLSKKGYASLEIVIETRDVNCLYIIKHKLGGSVKMIASGNAIRYRLHNLKGILDLINRINGLLLNPIRIAQLIKLCQKYNIQTLTEKPLEYNSAWLAGIIDSDGSVYINKASGQIFITITNNQKPILEYLVPLYGGKIYYNKSTNSFKWTVYKKNEILKLVNYFHICPCISKKIARILVIPNFMIKI